MGKAPSPRSASAADALAANLLAMRRKVHVARRQLQLTDADYRAILLRVTTKASSADCGHSDLEALLKEFRRLGWKGAQPAKGAPQQSQKAQVQLIYGLWAQLRPHLADGSVEALRAFVRRQTRGKANPEGISAPEFLDPRGANRVVEGLKAWLRREENRAAAAPPEDAA